MSLYYEASAILANEDKRGGSLKSRIFGAKDLKSPPVKIYALIIESLKWSLFLKEVIERSDLLKLERKLNPQVSVLLVHDLLLSKGGIAAPAKHALRISIEKYRARLSAELTKCRIRNGFPSMEEFRKHVNGNRPGSNELTEGETQYQHPRWIRVNTIKNPQDSILSQNFTGFERVKKLSEILIAQPLQKAVCDDEHIPNLFAIPCGFDVSKMPGYSEGALVLQDKASCFPAYLLDPSQCEGDIIDTCAAPGNKTTHLATFVHSSTLPDAPQRKIFAFERDKQRSVVLKKLVMKAGAENIVTVFGNTDFLAMKPEDPRFANVGALLLDPSCSGTGIVGRDDEPIMHLPEATPSSGVQPNPKKRKRSSKPQAEKAMLPEITEVDMAEEEDTILSERLRTLSAFQLKLLEHAMHFPKATRITYSTCSIHYEENEAVVVNALASKIARDAGWRIMTRSEQPDGLRKWQIRGSEKDCSASMGDIVEVDFENTPEEIADACIRCEKGTKEGTMGFFVAGFVRDIVGEDGADSTGREEWKGFSDDEDN